jgi:hypothetical protein
MVLFAFPFLDITMRGVGIAKSVVKFFLSIFLHEKQVRIPAGLESEAMSTILEEDSCRSDFPNTRTPNGPILGGIMDDDRFWSLIESAWKKVGGKTKLREKLAEGKLSDEKAEELQETVQEVMPALQEMLGQLSADDLLAFDRILEQKLYDIDRAEVQEQTDGSDDGFLYARGFIVAAGKGYYDAVNANPKIAMIDLECEDMCYISWHLYNEKFGEMPTSKISRESCSNKAGWPDLAR